MTTALTSLSFAVSFAVSVVSVVSLASLAGCAASAAPPFEDVGTAQAALTAIGTKPPPTTKPLCTILAPDGPPTAASTANGEFSLGLFRNGLDQTGRNIFAAVAAVQPNVSMRWASHAVEPNVCGYDCVTPAVPRATGSCAPTLNQNEFLIQAQLHFTASMAGVSRELYVNVDFTFSCDGWRTGHGQLNLTTSRPQVLVVDDDNMLVDFLDFFSNDAVSTAIDSAIRSKLDAFTPSETSTSLGSCSSLGAVVNTSTNQYWNDLITWDR